MFKHLCPKSKQLNRLCSTLSTLPNYVSYFGDGGAILLQVPGFLRPLQSVLNLSLIKVAEDGLTKLVIYIIFMIFYEHSRKKVKSLVYCIETKSNTFSFNKFSLTYFTLCSYYISFILKSELFSKWRNAPKYFLLLALWYRLGVPILLWKKSYFDILEMVLYVVAGGLVAKPWFERMESYHVSGLTMSSQNAGGRTNALDVI